jgi:general secretion pathway protein I
MKSSNSRGFTLLEVMVALAIIAFVLFSLSGGLSQYVWNYKHLENRTVAAWVANNLMVEYRLKSPMPAPGNTKGKEEMSQREWYWQVKISNTEEKNIRRIDIEVRQDEDDVLPTASLIGFVGNR